MIAEGQRLCRLASSQGTMLTKWITIVAAAGMTILCTVAGLLITCAVSRQRLYIGTLNMPRQSILIMLKWNILTITNMPERSIQIRSII